MVAPYFVDDVCLVDVILIEAAGYVGNEACFLCASQAVDEGVVFHDPLAIQVSDKGTR